MSDDDPPFFIEPKNPIHPSKIGRMIFDTDKTAELKELDKGKIEELKRMAFEKYGEKGFQLASELFQTNTEITTENFWEEFNDLRAENS